MISEIIPRKKFLVSELCENEMMSEIYKLPLPLKSSENLWFFDDFRGE